MQLLCLLQVGFEYLGQGYWNYWDREVWGYLGQGSWSTWEMGLEYLGHEGSYVVDPVFFFTILKLILLDFRPD